MGWQSHDGKVGAFHVRNTGKTDQVLYSVRTGLIERLVPIEVVVDQLRRPVGRK